MKINSQWIIHKLICILLIGGYLGFMALCYYYRIPTGEGIAR